MRLEVSGKKTAGKVFEHRTSLTEKQTKQEFESWPNPMLKHSVHRRNLSIATNPVMAP
jgi:hypothetical protein